MLPPTVLPVTHALQPGPCNPVPALSPTQVLPAMVPAPLETFAWEDIAAVAYPPAQVGAHTGAVGGPAMHVFRTRNSHT